MRKVCVVTGTRAEYGLLKKLLCKIMQSKQLELQLLVTGMHLSPEFGHTVSEIEADGIPVHYRLDMLLSGDSPAAITKSLGVGLIGFADAFRQLQPDLLLVLGDRFEVLAAAQAAMIFNIPIGHIHGGEATEGLIDEAIRHAVTKMSHLHFTAAEAYRKRVVQLGEDPQRVFDFGSLALDALQDLQLLSAAEIEKRIGISVSDPFFLITHHPLTLSANEQEKEVNELFAALDAYPEMKMVFTMPNADTNGRSIGKRIRDYAAKDPSRIHCFTSLGQLLYLSLMKHCRLVLGNSSSGLIEAPFFSVPTINIGDRQKGRLMASSVIQARADRKEIKKAIDQALSPTFAKALAKLESPYGNGKAAEKIVEVISRAELGGILKKSFYNL